MTVSEPPPGIGVSTSGDVDGSSNAEVGGLHREGMPPPAPGTDLTAVDRILTLTDEVIGLRAELAETHYRSDHAMKRAREDWMRQRALLEERAGRSEQQVEALLASRSWRFAQVIARPVHAVVRRGRRSG